MLLSTLPGSYLLFFVSTLLFNYPVHDNYCSGCKQAYTFACYWPGIHQAAASPDNIDVHSADKKLHKLRIECKKLRYLLEYFAPLFTAGAYQCELKKLKQLQGYLGDFNDSAVEHDFLSHYLADKNNSSRYKAVRKLRHISRKQHQQARAHILQQLRYFLLAQTKRNSQHF